jgi:hypothetical protein
MKDTEKKKGVNPEGTADRGKEKLSRREAMKRMAKGIALVGTLGVTAVVTQGQDECSGAYVNVFPPGYYNYSNGYYNYQDSYYNYNDSYYNTYSNFYSNMYYNYSDYSDYSNQYNNFYGDHYFNYYNW